MDVPQIIQDGCSAAQDLTDSFVSRLNYEIDIKPIIETMNVTIHQFPSDIIEIQVEKNELIRNIGEMPKIDNETFDTFDSYKQLADKINFLLKFLNKECGFEYKLLDKSTEEYDTISNHIIRYTPLVGNYNELIESAQSYNESDEETVKNFYISLGVFGFEFALIFGHVWYKTSFNVVGVFYKYSGLNRLAFKCPTLISTILSMAHWELRNKLVDETSNLMKRILMGLPFEVIKDVSSKTMT